MLQLVNQMALMHPYSALGATAATPTKRVGAPRLLCHHQDLDDPLGIIMALHLFKTQHPSNSNRAQLRLLVAYENGGVTLFAFTRAGMDTSVEGVGWDRVWTTKLHVETG